MLHDHRSDLYNPAPLLFPAEAERDRLQQQLQAAQDAAGEQGSQLAALGAELAAVKLQLAAEVDARRIAEADLERAEEAARQEVRDELREGLLEMRRQVVTAGEACAGGCPSCATPAIQCLAERSDCTKVHALPGGCLVGGKVAAGGCFVQWSGGSKRCALHFWTRGNAPWCSTSV